MKTLDLLIVSALITIICIIMGIPLMFLHHYIIGCFFVFVGGLFFGQTLEFFIDWRDSIKYMMKINERINE